MIGPVQRMGGGGKAIGGAHRAMIDDGASSGQFRESRKLSQGELMTRNMPSQITAAIDRRQGQLAQHVRMLRSAGAVAEIVGIGRGDPERQHREQRYPPDQDVDDDSGQPRHLRHL